MYNHLYQKFVAIGALTAKTYAFKARPWELRTTEALDLFDAMGSNIRIDVRDLQIVRVLPRINSDLNEDWITDKARFFFDALYKQRCLRGRVAYGLHTVEADALFLQRYVSDVLVSRFVGKINFIVGFFNSVEVLYRQKLAANFFLNSQLMLPFARAVASRDLDFRINYIFEESLASIERCSALLLFGVLLRYEAPLVAVRVRRAVKHSGLRPIYLGVYGDVYNGGLRVSDSIAGLLGVLQGRHLVVQLFYGFLARAPIGCIFGTGAHGLVRNVFNNLMLEVKSRFLALHEVNFRSRFNSANVPFLFYNMSTCASVVAAYDLGIGTLEEQDGVDLRQEVVSLDENGAKIVDVLGGFEVIKYETRADCVIASGSHWNSTLDLARFDVILPDLAPYEALGFYANVEGRYQVSSKVLDTPINPGAFDLLSRALAPYDSLNVAFRARLLNGWANGLLSDFLVAYLPNELQTGYISTLAFRARIVNEGILSATVLHVYVPWLSKLGVLTNSFVIDAMYRSCISQESIVVTNFKCVAENLSFYKSDFLTSSSYTLMLGYQRFSYRATPYRKELGFC